MYRIAICDDSKIDRSFFIDRIKHLEETYMENQIHEFDSGQSLLDTMKYISFDLILLDMQMSGMNGDQVSREIRRIDVGVVLVFITGFVEPSPEFFEVQPLRYIMKNKSLEEMDEDISFALVQMVKQADSPHLFAKIANIQVRINPDDIIYIEKDKKKLRVHIRDLALESYGIKREGDKAIPDIFLADKLETVYEKLKKHGFGWPHDSYIVNLLFVTAYNSKTLKLAESTVAFQITRSKGPVFNELCRQFFHSKYIVKDESRDE